MTTRNTNIIHGDTSTLDGARYILTVKNQTNRLYAEGSLDAGTKVVCLRKNESGYYLPCNAFIVEVKPPGRITVDLYDDRSERITVSSKAILWPTPKAATVSVATDGITVRWTFEPLPDGKQGFAVFEGNLLVAVVGECAARPEYALDLVKMVTAAPELYHAAIGALAYLQPLDMGERGKTVVADLIAALTMAAE